MFSFLIKEYEKRQFSPNVKHKKPTVYPSPFWERQENPSRYDEYSISEAAIWHMMLFFSFFGMKGSLLLMVTLFWRVTRNVRNLLRSMLTMINSTKTLGY